MRHNRVLEERAGVIEPFLNGNERCHTTDDHSACVGFFFKPNQFMFPVDRKNINTNTTLYY